MKTIWTLSLLGVGLALLAGPEAHAQSPGKIRISPPVATTLPPIGLKPKRLPSIRQPTIAQETQDRRQLRQRLDGSTVRPRVRETVPSDEAIAQTSFGRPALDPARAGIARSGPTAFGQNSAATPSIGGRRVPQRR